MAHDFGKLLETLRTKRAVPDRDGPTINPEHPNKISCSRQHPNHSVRFNHGVVSSILTRPTSLRPPDKRLRGLRLGRPVFAADKKRERASAWQGQPSG
jgi:hypothetical protein